MFFNNHRQADGRERLIDSLMETDFDERRQVMMAALQRGDIRLSEAEEVLHTVARLEALAAPMSSSPGAGPA